ncbi:MAG: Asp-tRNA(Asn)/Glu-tRNA(Gln) amidotransferase subunit GatC [Epsilonproteobacteria bacterium]|nr:Asp-tRNA(Asn)/Glu-tRNA(Gln) amidotransferase subunit GatC [Campylobacterota bacterium]
MQIDETLLKRLERLSYLQISEEKRAEVIEQLSEIVGFVDNLSELDTSDIDATFTMSDNATPMREDVAFCETQINDDILKNAPDAQENFFVVPKIIE